MRALGFTTLLLLIGAAYSSPAFSQYGLDEVPNSTFYHYDEWRHYGSDPVPNTYKHTDGLATTFGVDSIPGVVRERFDLHPHHELIHATIQHLTAATEYTPAPRRAKAAVKPTAPKATSSGLRSPRFSPSR